MEYKSRNEVPNEYKWNLSKLYKNDKLIEQDIEKLKSLNSKLLEFKNHILDDENTLYDFLNVSVSQDRIIEKLYVYSKMKYDEDTNNNKSKSLYMKIEKIVDELSEKLSFISPELMRTDYSKVLEYIKKNKKLEEYKFYLESIYRYAPHILSESEEEVFSKAMNSLGVCSEIFNNINNADINLGIIMDENNKEVKLTSSNYNIYMKSNVREIRKNAFDTMYNYYKSLKNTLAATYVGQIKEDTFVTKTKKYDSNLHQSLFGDNIDISVYDNLIKTVHDNLDAMYNYIKLRKKFLNVDELHMYDIYVDLAENDNNSIEFDEAKKIIFEALKPLGKKYIEDLKKAFKEGWIDIYPNAFKKSGAYSWGCYDSYPYLLLNYNNTFDSVSTMAHELGHSMHSYYSKSQNYIDSQYPIFLAEIASTVNEVLLNDYMYKHAKTKNDKIFFLTDLIDLIRATIYRQTMFAEFERIIHDKYDKGISLTEEEISNTYYELNKLYYGDSIVSDDNIRYEWSRIPHFYTPFYVYKYATGLSSALSIASSILNGDEEIKEKYLKFLSSGGSDYPLNILKSVNVDMMTTKPIEDALKVFKEKLNELEKLI